MKMKDYSIGVVILGDDGSPKPVEHFFATEVDAHEFAIEEDVTRYFLVRVYGQPEIDKAAFLEYQAEQKQLQRERATAPMKRVKTKTEDK